MASSGYIDSETDMESIWDMTIPTARFALINVQMGEILNFLVRPDKDSQTDITDTKITSILKHISEEALMELLQASKSNKNTDPWLFIQANVFRIISKVYRANTRIIKELKEQQEAKLHLKYSNKLTLPSHRD